MAQSTQRNNYYNLSCHSLLLNNTDLTQSLNNLQNEIDNISTKSWINTNSGSTEPTTGFILSTNGIGDNAVANEQIQITDNNVIIKNNIKIDNDTNANNILVPNNTTLNFTNANGYNFDNTIYVNGVPVGGDANLQPYTQSIQVPPTNTFISPPTNIDINGNFNCVNDIVCSYGDNSISMLDINTKLNNIIILLNNLTTIQI